MTEIFQTAGGCHAAIVNNIRIEGGLSFVREAIEEVGRTGELSVKPRCAGCGRIRGEVTTIGDLYRCSHCKYEYDDEIPSGRLEREDRRKERRKL